MTVHIPILVEPIVQALVEPLLKLPDSAPPHWIIDCTLGGGGHTGSLLQKMAEDPRLKRHHVLSMDQDSAAIASAQERFRTELSEGRLELAHCRISETLPIIGGRPVLGLMADLGFSSDQLEDSSRGLSFQAEGPLDMRLDPSRGMSAYEYLAQVSEEDLVKIIQEYGEERFTRRIAHAIISARRDRVLPKTSKELADLIVRAVPPPARRQRIHAATRTFQAIRIAVNQELEELDYLLGHVILLVKPGGRVAILSFHSLEDRKVKLVFKDRDSAFQSLSKKPVVADEKEIARNPRSRSAKLRIAERLP